MENIKEAIVHIMNVSKYQEILENFARQKYREKFPARPSDGGYHYYTGFTIISETKIRIDYDCGAGEYEFSDSFIVDLIPEIRDNNINEILK